MKFYECLGYLQFTKCVKYANLRGWLPSLFRTGLEGEMQPISVPVLNTQCSFSIFCSGYVVYLRVRRVYFDYFFY